MLMSGWFIWPLAGFGVLSVVRIALAISHFDPQGSLSEDSFDIVTGWVPTVDTLGALLAVAAIVTNGKPLDFPAGAIDVVAACAILLVVGAVTGFYLKAMVPDFRISKDDKRFQFPSAYYPCVKAVFVTAQFVMIASAGAYVIALVARMATTPAGGA